MSRYGCVLCRQGKGTHSAFYKWFSFETKKMAEKHLEEYHPEEYKEAKK